MRSLSVTNNLSDMDENQFLNGRGSLVILPANLKKTARKNSLKDHIKKHSATYIIMIALAVTFFVIVHIEKEYQLSLKKASEDLAFIENNAPSENKNMRTSPQKLEEMENQRPLGYPALKKQPEKPKMLSKKKDQFAQVNNVKTTLNIIPQDLLPEKFKTDKTPPVPREIQKTSKSAQSNTALPENKADIAKIAGNKAGNQQIIPNKQIEKTSAAPRPKPANAGTRPIAGVSQEQRQMAQKWLGLKDQNIFQNSDLADQERSYYQQKYNISSYSELPFCIVIPSYNNVKEKRHLKNIKSVIMQEYTNYHIVFIDDASSDGTGTQIQTFLESQSKVSRDKYILIKNTQQKRAMPNLRRAAKELCRPQDIFLIVDGDDELLGRQVLKLFNAIFQSKKSWFVYSNFLTIRGSVGYSRPFPQSTITSNKYRSYPFVTSHLRAFYTQLFVNINETDLLDQHGAYLKAANDVAICIPILQMSHQRVYYLPELTYYYNSNTGQNNHQLRLKQQKANDRMLRKRKSYSRLKELQFSSNLGSTQASTSTPVEVPESLQISKGFTTQQILKKHN